MMSGLRLAANDGPPAAACGDWSMIGSCATKKLERQSIQSKSAALWPAVALGRRRGVRLSSCEPAMVGGRGIEPLTPSMSMTYTPPR